MGRAILAISGSTAGFLNRPMSDIGRTVGAFCRDLVRTLFHPYRPERHYMRGPGPACRAKQAAPRG